MTNTGLRKHAAVVAALLNDARQDKAEREVTLRRARHLEHQDDVERLESRIRYLEGYTMALYDVHRDIRAALGTEEAA